MLISLITAIVFTGGFLLLNYCRRQLQIPNSEVYQAFMRVGINPKLQNYLIVITMVVFFIGALGNFVNVFEYYV